MFAVYFVLALAATVHSAPTLDYSDTHYFGREGIIWDSANNSWAEWVIGSDPTAKLDA